VPKVLYELVKLHMKDVATVLYELMELHMENVATVLYELMQLPVNRCQGFCMSSWSCL
jgi:hypothetical protein